MPKEIEEKLKRAYARNRAKLKKKGVDEGRYVYGAMNRMKKEGRISW